MSSVLTSIKQVPVTGGKFVCVLADVSNAYAVTSLADRLPADQTADIVVPVGTELNDLGVTYVVKPTTGSSMNTVYRKVVSVAEAQKQNPTAYFIKTVDPAGTVRFARTA